MKLLFDEMLRNTASWMRIFGVDSAYFHPSSDNELIELAKNDNRILITRDKELANRCKKHGVKSLHINEVNIKKQLKFIVQRLNIKLNFPGATRCPECNAKLLVVQKQLVKGLVPPDIFKERKKFWICQKCNKAYWKGSHWKSILKMHSYLVSGME